MSRITPPSDIILKKLSRIREVIRTLSDLSISAEENPWDALLQQYCLAPAEGAVSSPGAFKIINTLKNQHELVPVGADFLYSNNRQSLYWLTFALKKTIDEKLWKEAKFILALSTDFAQACDPELLSQALAEKRVSGDFAGTTALYHLICALDNAKQAQKTIKRSLTACDERLSLAIFSGTQKQKNNRS